MIMYQMWRKKEISKSFWFPADIHTLYIYIYGFIREEISRTISACSITTDMTISKIASQILSGNPFKIEEWKKCGVGCDPNYLAGAVLCEGRARNQIASRDIRWYLTTVHIEAPPIVTCAVPMALFCVFVLVSLGLILFIGGYVHRLSKDS